MLFNSYLFIGGFLPAVLVGFFVIPWQRARLIFICGASYVFYAYARTWFPVLMLVDTTVAFGVGLALNRVRRRGVLLAVGIASVLSLLAYFKYAHFLLGNGLDAFDTLTGRGFPSTQQFLRGIVLPVGISFFTFECISYLVDVYRGDLEPERNPLRFAFFVSFFPHLIAGPIVRYGQLAPQLVNRYRLDWSKFNSGLLLFSLGLAKKVLLADSLAARTDAPFAAVGSLGLWSSWLAVLAYSFQIYFDFSGYCDMALGLARMFGIDLPWNFNRPYRAASPREFWRRWNVTLSQWLRDYLYIPLGGSRTTPARRDVNLLATMGLGGLWHGAGGNFVLWGLFHGGLLVGNRHAERLPFRLPRPVAVAVTFALVTVGWVLFRIHSLAGDGHVFAAMAGAHGVGGFDWRLLVLLVISAVVMWGLPEEWSWKLGEWTAPRVALVGVVTAFAVIWIGSARPFIYFQF